MRTVSKLAVATALSLACVGTYVAHAQWTHFVRVNQLGTAQAATVKFLQGDFSGQIAGPLPRVADLEAVSRRAINCFQTLNFDSLYEALPSWNKERVGLQQARDKVRVEADKKLTDAQVAQQVKQADPKETLRVTGKASFVGLTRAQYFAWSQGWLRLHDDEDALRRFKGEWFMVDASIGTIINQMSGSSSVLQSGAMVQFENVPGDKIAFLVIVLDDAWVVSKWASEVGDFRESNFDRDQEYVPRVGSSPETMAAEGKAALVTIKDRLRTKYVQNDNKLDPTWKLSDLVNVSELEGHYYASSDYSLSDLDQKSALLRAAGNQTTGAPSVTMYIIDIAKDQYDMYSDDEQRRKDGGYDKDDYPKDSKDGPPSPKDSGKDKYDGKCK